jgi:holo-[acyl-carrier protein] synthase
VIVGIGTDIVSIERIAGVLERHGERFVNRVLTPAERARYEQIVGKAKVGHLAKRWAAKEAFAKAIGTGIHPPFSWQSITIGRDALGKPGIIPDAGMAKYLAGRGVASSHISLSDDAGMAVAFVVLEG